MEALATKIKICKLFYEEGLSKIEIGEKVRMSRFKVAKVIDDAVSDGIVNIRIKQLPHSFIDLENALEKKYRMYQAVITDTGVSYEETKQNIGKAAAEHVRELIQDNDNIGLAWGSTIHEMVEAFPEITDKKHVTIVQLTGGLHQVSKGFNPIDLTSKLGNKISNSELYQLFAPAIVDKEETKNILLNESSIRETLNQFKNINIAIVGIGSMVPKPSTMLYRDGFIRSEEFEKIQHLDLAGDINSHFYDSNGVPAHTFLDQRTIGIDLEQLSKIRYVMALAGGEDKALAIHAALKGRVINMLVTDRKTAEALLEMDCPPLTEHCVSPHIQVYL